MTERSQHMSSNARFALLCIGVWLHSADTLVTATIAPAIVDDLGGIAYINWTISLYEVGAIIAGAAAAMLCLRFGIKRVFVAATLTYGGGCLLGALAPSMAVLIVGRLVQGMGGGMLLSLCYVAVEAWYTRDAWGRLFSIVALIWGVGSLIGPLIGGAFAGRHTWRGAFWAFALQAAALCALAAWSFPSAARSNSSATRPNSSAARSKPNAVLSDATARSNPDVVLSDATASPPLPHAARPEQLAGAWPVLQLLVLCAATLVIAVAGATSGIAASIGGCALGIALLYLAARLDRHAAVRLLPAELLDLRHPVGAGLATVFALSVATTGFWAYGPLVVKILFGTQPLVTGYILAGEAVAWSLATMAVSSATPAADRWLIRAGAVCVTVGSAGFAVTVPSGTLTGMVFCGLAQGAGFGLCWPAIVQRIVRSSGAAEQSLASASASTVQRIGYAVGTAAVGIAANLSGLAEGVSVAAAKAAGFWVFAAFVPVLMLALLAAWQFTARAAPPNPAAQ
jgi:MFS family permease